MTNFLKDHGRLVSFNLLMFLILGLILSWAIFGPQISVRNGRTAIKSGADIFFYIPSLSPIKVYKVDTNSQKLQQILVDDTKETNATFGIYIKNLNTGQSATLNSKEQFQTASLYKLPLMYAIFYNHSKGKLDINDPTIEKNLKMMITVSSNDAAYFFIDNNYTSWQQTTDLMHQMGLKNTDLVSQDQPVSTPEDMGYFLEKLADGNLVSYQDSLSMLNLLSQQQINDRIPALLPRGTLVAHKTGDLEDVVNDAGIVAGSSSDYVIVLMSKDCADPEQTKKIMQKISFDVYNFFENQFANPAEIL
jgi:beta-lactamase class A